MKPIDPRELRTAFGRFMTGVTVVTARDKSGKPVGFTANSFTSVSLDPPLLLVCPGKFLSSYEAFATCDRFCVSVLEESQTDVANTFAGFKGDRFAKTDHLLDAHGIPAPRGAIARFSCQTHNAIPAGDHVILIGEVTAFEQTAGAGLGYAEGQFFSLTRERNARDPSAKMNVVGALVRHQGNVLLEKTADGYRLPECTVPERTALRKSLTATLRQQGVTASFGPVYSVFDDPGEDTHFAYLLAEATSVAADTKLTSVAPKDLPGLKFTSPPLASLLSRYAQECRTGNLNCYLGDTVSGEIHALTEGI
ncbi:flavin reductase family protein [Labrenzia sp. PHM005]|uniref:flavin reductase family protein n=1 Tax=Labrenzia sp. PHM005 TaxID=2590016 RepID=UPI001AD91861|nr:flavin reductase family protein [Labrenzia sp. PHM005]